MLVAPIPENDPTRVEALESLNLLDTESEERFDRITRLGQILLNVPIVLVSLVDKNRQWFKSKCGLDAPETERDISFCGHAIMEDELFYIPDTLEDKRFFDNPLVTGPPDIRFYAGYPIKERITGLNVGTLCFIDTKPKFLTEEDRKKIFDLAKIAENEINILTLTRAMIIQKESEERVKEVMDSVGEGILLIKPTLLIGPKYSKWTEILFQTNNIANRKFLDLINEIQLEDKIQDVNNFLQLMFKDTVDENTLVQLNPLKEFKCKINEELKYLNIKINRVYEEENIKHLVCTIVDITKEKLLAIELEERDRKTQSLMEKMFDVLHVEPAMLLDFITGTELELASIEELLNFKKEDPIIILNEVYRSVHTIKGDASLLGLNIMVERAHALETYLSEILQKELFGVEERLEIKKELNAIDLIIEEIKKIIEKFKTFQKEMKIGSGAEMLLSLIEKQIQKLTKSSNKEIVFNNSNFNSSLVPVKYRKIMKDIILQLVKNSIDHGIESKEDRILMGKPVKGYIHIENEIIGDRLYIYYEDDGRGLKIDEIKKVALKKKIINEVELRSEEESKFSKLIFVPGLSTAEKVTFTSGRGVGMDIVKKQIDYLSGEININFEKDKFCKFTLTFPL